MYITLNISATGIRILSVKGRQAKKWGEAPIMLGLVRDGLILQPEAVGKAIDALFKSTQLPRKRVIVSLTGLSFTYRILSLPRMKPTLLEEAIRRGAKKEIPLPSEDLYLSWQDIGGQRDERDFFVLGVPRKLIDALIQTLAMAGIEPYLMDLKPLALARAADRIDALVVALEPDSFDIVLIVNGTPTIMHTLNPRGEGATLEDNIQRLADELSRTTDFYNNSHPENPTGPSIPLLLTGALSSDAATSKLIQAETGYSVQPLIPSLKFPPELPIALYASSMGLALKKIPPEAAAKGDAARFQDINLNILSAKLNKARTRPVSSRYILFGAAMIIAIGLLLPIYDIKSRNDAEIGHLQAELGRVRQELNQARLISEKAKHVQDTIAEMASEAETLQQEHQDILSTKGDFTNNLKLITEALPPQAYFTSMEVGSGQITVRGETDSPFTVISYAMALETQGLFSEIRITEIDEVIIIETGDTEAEGSPVETNVITFDIVMNK